MSESKAEQIAAALQAQITARMVGDGGVNYWFTPDLIGRVPAMTMELLDSSVTTIVTLSPDEQDEEESDTVTDIRENMLLHVGLATKFTPATENNLANQPSPTRATLQERLLQDLKKALQADPRIGGSCLWAHVIRSDKSDKNTFVSGWAVAFASILLEFTYTEGTP